MRPAHGVLEEAAAAMFCSIVKSGRKIKCPLDFLKMDTNYVITKTVQHMSLDTRMTETKGMQQPVWLRRQTCVRCVASDSQNVSSWRAELTYGALGHPSPRCLWRLPFTSKYLRRIVHLL